MKPFIRLSLIAVAASTLTISAAVAQTANNPPPGPPRMQQWAVDHEAMLDAKLAGLKAGLKLTPDQEKLWGPFEAAARAAADMHMKHMEEMMARMHEMRGDDMEKEGSEEGEGVSPIDRLDRLANRLSEAGAALKKLADAAKPLYDSLDEQQKRVFGFLSREMMRMGHPGMEEGRGAEGGHRWRGEGEGGPGGHHRWHGEGEGGPDDEE